MENKWKEWLVKIKKHEKLPKKNQILILLLAGILLLIIAFPVPKDDKKEEEDTQTQFQPQAEDKSMSAYQEYLERRTAEVLGEVEGVGKVSVMITLRSSAQKVIEKDQQTSSQSTEEEDSEGGTRSTADSSSDKTSVYTQDADGSQSPYVSKELTPEVEGVIVVADGGDNAVTVQNISEAVQALFGVEAHKIKIMKRHSIS